MNWFSRSWWKQQAYGWRTRRRIPQYDPTLFVGISLLVLIFIIYALLKANRVEFSTHPGLLATQR
jgi:hypothetical protein